MFTPQTLGQRNATNQQRVVNSTKNDDLLLLINVRSNLNNFSPSCGDFFLHSQLINQKNRINSRHPSFLKHASPSQIRCNFNNRLVIQCKPDVRLFTRNGVHNERRIIVCYLKKKTLHLLKRRHKCMLS